MALQILEEFKSAQVDIYTSIYCSGFLHDQKDKFCASTIELFDENCFLDEFQYNRKRTQTWKLRGLIRKIRKSFDYFKPDMVLTFTDNSYIYQSSFKRWKSSAKIVLFHEGYGDYAAPTSKLREILPYLYIQIVVWPYTYLPVVRSYTGLYDYSFLLQPDIVDRDFIFKKIQIPSNFMKSIFYKETALAADIEPKSILFTLSGKDWANDKKLKAYLQNCVLKLQPLNRRIYIKIAPNVNSEDYKFLLQDGLVTLIDDPQLTSESYCYHPSFDYIVTDESSAVINAMYGGVQKTFFFLNGEIQKEGVYKYESNALLKFLQNKKYINQVTIKAMVEQIKNNIHNKNFIDTISCESVGNELRGILNG